MAKTPDHMRGIDSIGKSSPGDDLRRPASNVARIGHNQPVEATVRKMRVRHSSFGGRSTCLAEATFDPNVGEITVTFDRDGSTYSYPCTLEDWNALREAESVGQEFNFNIKT